MHRYCTIRCEASGTSKATPAVAEASKASKATCTYYLVINASVVLQVKGHFNQSTPHTSLPTHRSKHPVTAHMSTGISLQGRTGICTLDGTMDRFLYTDILQKTFLPFVAEVYGSNHRYMQDNDPEHVSNHAKDFLNSDSINWWKMPPKSPDLNLIENLRHKLKQYIG